MKEPAIAVTNNIMASQKLKDRLPVVFTEGGLMDVLTLVRDYIHKGHKLLTHPLSGSVKPNETPFKTILISKDGGKTIDMDSLLLIESGIHAADKFIRDRKTPNWPEPLLEDFRLIDYDLIYNALNS